MVLAMIVHRKHPGIASAAWIVLFMGTVACWVAVSSGFAAYDKAIPPDEASSLVMQEHLEMGVNIRLFFTLLCIGYGLLVFLPYFVKRLRTDQFHIVGSLLILVFYAPAALYLANAAHKGGRLVHEYLMVAPTGDIKPDPVQPTQSPPASAPATTTAPASRAATAP